MEAAPRLPMISFDLQVSPEPTSFTSVLKSYIANYYHEDPEAYNTEIHNLEKLREIAVNPVVDVNSSQILKKYYCQLHFLKSRFPMEEGQPAAVPFTWKNAENLHITQTVSDIRFELSCILYNIGALHSQLGAQESRNSPEGMKMACTHFQCAAWAFQTIKEVYWQQAMQLNFFLLAEFMYNMCLAQAQECILEKSMLDNRKATIIAKIAIQVYEYYRKCLSTLETITDPFNNTKEWTKYLHMKQSYHRCISYLFQGQQAEEQQKMGERVAFYQLACEQLEEARKYASQLKSMDLSEALAFTSDVVEGKRKAAKNENEFIYHEEVPIVDNLEKIKGASLVKGIPFSVHDVEVSGPDIFSRLVPMEVHEASSLYSEKKANMVRQLGELVEGKDHAVAEFMSSMQLELLHKMKEASGIPQEIIDRAAALSARPNAIKDLVEAMSKLSNTYHDVEAMLNEIDGLLKEEEENERKYQEIMGKRPPSILATDLSREAAKYREAHNKANESNQNLHKAMTTHVANLKILNIPLRELDKKLPSIVLPDKNIDEQALKELEAMIAKVEEMRTQRAMLWTQLRENVKNDDITQTIITQPKQNLDMLFEKELRKHQEITSLIETNAAAQEKIKAALVNAYANCVNTRRYIQDVLQKRSTTISALIASYDTYDDLLAKANKGIEFYSKLETNVSKLLQRIKSTIKVQQEERDQMLGKTSENVSANVAPPAAATTPKLKDYMESRKKKAETANFDQSVSQYPNYPNQDTQWPPGVRPTPVGSEVNDIAAAPVQNPGQEGFNVQYGYTNPYASHYQSGFPQPGQSNYVPQNYSYGYSVPASTPSTFPADQGLNSSNYPAQVSTPLSYQTPSNYPIQASTASNYPTHVQNQPSTSLNYPIQTSTPSSYPVQAAMASNYTPQNANASGYPVQVSTSMTYPIPSSTPSNYPVQTSTPLNYAGYSSQTATSTNYGVPSSTTNYPSQIPTQNYQIPTNQGQYQAVTSTTQTNYQNDDLVNRMNALLSSKNTDSNVGTQYSYGGYDAAQSYPGYQNSGQTYDSSNFSGQTYQNSYPAYQNSDQIYQNPNQVYPNSDQSYANAYGVSYPNKQDYQSYTAQTYGSPSAYDHTKAFTTTTNSSSQPISSNGNDSAYQSDYYYQNMPNGSSAYNYGNNYHSVEYASSVAPNIHPIQQSTYSSPIAATNTNPSNPTRDSMNAAEAASAGNYYNYTTNQVPATPPNSSTEIRNKESNVDLLSGLDFTISQAPLVPQSSKDVKKEESVKEEPDTSTKVEEKPKEDVKVKQEIKELKPLSKSKPLNNSDVLKLIHQEFEKYEKFVDVLPNKTLNGPTTLDVKWKEIQDSQDGVMDGGQKKIISVARCYPMKNRFPDILPYDFSRVELVSADDDYINASLIRDISAYAPNFIVTQAPLSSTIGDFWTMVKEQQIELIFCVLSDNEISDIYWPREKGQNLNVLNMVISLQSVIVKTNWTERLISVTIPEKRESWAVMHLQFNSWPGSLFPTNPESFVAYTSELMNLHQQQRNLSHPVLVHCASGIGRSGVLCLLALAIYEITNNSTSIPDLAVLAMKLTNFRRNFLRDREHLKFAYEAFLTYMRQLTNQDKLKKKLNEVVEIKEEGAKAAVKEEVKEIVDDPLNSLDPFWVTKK